MHPERRRPSAPLVISFIALAVAITGSAAALPGTNTVKSNDIKKNAVKTSKLKDDAVKTPKLNDGAVTGPKIAANAVDASKILDGSIISGDIADNAITASEIADGAVSGSEIADGAVSSNKIADGAITGSDIADGSINDTKLSDYEVIGGSYLLATATTGASEAAAQAAAPRIDLFSKGQLTIYARCFQDTSTNTTFAEIYGETSVDFSIQEGTDDLPGGNAATEFLNTTTLENDRELDTQTATGNDADYDETEFAMASPDGTGLSGQLIVGAKNGTLAGGNGLYGAGNVCLFQGTVEG